MTKALISLALLVAIAAPASAQSCAEQSISWTEDGYRHTTVIEGRLRNGCPMMRQSIAKEGTPRIQEIGVDCDCDLVIDGWEGTFSPPLAIVSGRMLDVCEANKASYTPWDGAHADTAS